MYILCVFVCTYIYLHICVHISPFASSSRQKPIQWVICHVWMSHGTHMNEPLHAYEWVMSRMWMSHVTHMNESWHAYKWVMSRIWTSHIAGGIRQGGGGQGRCSPPQLASARFVLLCRFDKPPGHLEHYVGVYVGDVIGGNSGYGDSLQDGLWGCGDCGCKASWSLSLTPSRARSWVCSRSLARTRSLSRAVLHALHVMHASLIHDRLDIHAGKPALAAPFSKANPACSDKSSPNPASAFDKTSASAGYVNIYKRVTYIRENP